MPNMITATQGKKQNRKPNKGTSRLVLQEDDPWIADRQRIRKRNRRPYGVCGQGAVRFQTWEPWIIDSDGYSCAPFAIFNELYEHEHSASLHAFVAGTIGGKKLLFLKR
ncbi:MAG: hypothetical protein WA715_19950 [Candidatus Acidiferrum sp.]|jgi:hypothetical protein